MKQKGIKLGLAFFALVLILGAGAYTKAQQTQEEREQYKAMFQELGDMLREYKNESIHPQMLEWKEKLDAEMSSEDLAKLNELREKTAKLHEEMRQKKLEMREQMREKREQMREKREQMREKREQMREKREKMREKREKMRKKREKRDKEWRGMHGKNGKNGEMREKMGEIFEELKPIAEKYKETLVEIGEDAEPMHEKWREEMSEIKSGWEEKHESELEEMKDSKFGRKYKGHFGSHGLMGHGMCKDGKMKGAMFMLWNGEIKEPMRDRDEGSMVNPLGVEDEAYGQDGVRNYPNPFSESTTIYIEMPSEENVTLDVYDNLGKKIGTIYEGKLSQGEHEFEFNVKSGNYKGLQAGTYIYKLTAESFTKSGKMALTR